MKLSIKRIKEIIKEELLKEFTGSQQTSGGGESEEGRRLAQQRFDQAKNVHTVHLGTQPEQTKSVAATKYLTKGATAYYPGTGAKYTVSKGQTGIKHSDIGDFRKGLSKTGKGGVSALKTFDTHYAVNPRTGKATKTIKTYCP